MKIISKIPEIKIVIIKAGTGYINESGVKIPS